MKWISFVFLDKYIIKKMKATKSSLEEINTYEYYSLKNDNEHDYEKYLMAYKFENNSKEPNFLIIFGEKDIVDDFKVLGILNRKQLRMIKKITEGLSGEK